MKQTAQTDSSYAAAARSLAFSEEAKQRMSRALSDAYERVRQETAEDLERGRPLPEAAPGRRAAGRRISRAALLAAALVVVLTATVLAGTGVLGKPFALMLGSRQIDLDATTPLAVDLDALERYIALHPENPNNRKTENNITVQFPDQRAFAETLGFTLSGSDQVEPTVITIWINRERLNAHLSMDVTASGITRTLNGMFLLEDTLETEYGYGYKPGEFLRTSKYRYGEGKTAYFVKNTGAPTTSVYFTENGIMYQLAIENTDSDRAFAKKVIDAMAGLDG